MDATVDRRAAFLEAEADARLTWDAAVAAVPASQREERSLPQERSVKDLVAHVAAWERWGTERLEARRDGGPPLEIPDWETYEHAFNERAYARWRDEPWETVAREAAAAYGAFRAVVSSLDDELLEKSRRLIAACGSEHYAEYLPQIRSLVPGTP